MAQVPYLPTDTVAPDTRMPDDHQRIDARPDQFGAAIGQGLDKLSAGAARASQFYGQVAADDGTNTFVKGVNSILYGDPSKQVPQADGTMAPDTGYFGLKGADQMRAYPKIGEQIEALRQQVKSGLATPESQLEFDSYSRRFAQLKQSEVGEHYVRAQTDWATKTQTESAQITLGDIARQANDDKGFAGGLENLKSAYVRTAQIQGLGPTGTKLAVENANRDAWATRIEAISVNDPARAQKLVEDHKDELGTQYERMANSVRARADQATGEAFGKAELAKQKAAAAAGYISPGRDDRAPSEVPPLQRGNAETFTKYNSLLNSGDVAAALRLSEGLRTAPYWDVNHLRTGYGSDTVTLADGTVKTVDANTRITPADAERDLLRRTADYAKGARNAIGPTWDSLGQGAQAALTSMAYNYGHVPDDVVRAAKSGNPAAIAAAITNHANDNRGVNYNRRLAEANAVLGRGGLAPGASASSGLTTPAPEAAPVPERLGPEGAPADSPAAAADAPPSTAAPTAPDATLPAPPAPPPAAAPSPEEMKAKAIEAIQNSDMSFPAKQHAIRVVSEQIATEEMIDNQTAKAKKEASDKSADGFVTRMLAGNVPPNFIQQIANDPHLEWQTKLHLFHSGRDVEEAANAYGPGFWDAYKKVTAPAGSPEKISDPDELIKRAGPDGDLTLAGVAKLRQTMVESQKSANDASVVQAKAALLNYARSILCFDQEMLFPGVPPLKDQKGVQIFEAQFIPKFEAAYDQWIKAGKDPWEFLKKENVDKLLVGMRDPREMAKDRIAAGAEAVGGAGAAPPPSYAPPKNVDPGNWKGMLSSPPTLANGSRIDSDGWARVLNTFGANPNEEMAKTFDEDQAARSAAGRPTLAITGREILLGLQGKIKPLKNVPPAPPPEMPLYTGP